MIKVENEQPAHSFETFIGHDGIKQNPIYYSFPSRYKIAYQRELEHFLDVVQCKEFDFSGYLYLFCFSNVLLSHINFRWRSCRSYQLADTCDQQNCHCC